MTDLELLRTYEPILRFTHGELFFPTDVSGYVERCDLWLYPHDVPPRELVASGQLNLDSLAAAPPAGERATLAMRLVDRPLTGAALRDWRRAPERPVFRSAGRLARVGLLARLADAGFGLSLFLRGTVPGGTTASAHLKYVAAFQDRPSYCYYGRAVRESGYVILHYLFFYFMNDWRSTFHGANDHEADWEQAMVFLEEQSDAVLTPVWVAASCHESAGPDLRRRWDDPQLQRHGNHPILYAGAGSHAHYVQPGEYLHSLELRPLRPVVELLGVLSRFWRETLRQGTGATSADIAAFFSVPFVDYARGDGLAIGPGQTETWLPILIDDDTRWVHRYRGLFGLETRDWFAGERAPAGPRYNRDGSERLSWHSPVTWAGLAGVAPSAERATLQVDRSVQLEQELAAARRELETTRRRLRALQLEVDALRPGPAPASVTAEVRKHVAQLEAEHASLLQQIARLEVAHNALQADLPQPGPHAHLRHPFAPQPEAAARSGRLLELWAALSTGVLLLAVVAFFLVPTEWRVPVVGLILGGFVAIESILRRSLTRLLLNLTVALGVAGAAILLYEFRAAVLVIAVVAIAVLVVADNLRELIRG